MKYNVPVISAAFFLMASSVGAQVSVPADRTANIESDGPDVGVFYNAQFEPGGFDEYGVAEFSISQADFGGSTVTNLNSVTLSLAVTVPFFAADGPFTVFFTTDSLSDLSGASDYDALAFASGEAFGIDSTQFSYTPVAVATPTFSTATGEGNLLDITIDLATIGSDLLTAINSGDNVHFLIGVDAADDTTATFQGVGGEFAAPTLTIDATTSGLVPEPAAYPTDFTATPQFRNVELTWTDSADTAGYVVAISDDPTITAPVDGDAPVDDLDLSDGDGAIVAAQGLEAAEFLGLEENTQYYFSIFPYTNSGTDTDYKTDATAPTSTATTTETPTGVLITQYYESDGGSSKYIELSNISASPIDLSGYVITRWSNATAEDFKSAEGSPASLDLSPLGTLQIGESVLLADGDATSPVPAADTDLTQTFQEGGALSFNGNDSVVLYASSTIDPTNIVDAISFTDDGNEGANTGFVRIATTPGYDLVAGSDVLDFPSVWEQVDNATTDAAVFGDDAFLGTSGLVTPPPSVFFDSTSLLVNEGDGTVDLTVEIQNPDGNAVSVDVVFDAGDGIADASDIGSYTTQTVNFADTAVSGDQQTVTISLTDDAIEEVSEAAIFNLENLASTGNATIGAASTATINIRDNDTVVPNVFISEIADPSDNAGDGRYVELYNPTDSPINLGEGAWHLVMYFNENASGTDIPLTGVIPAGGTYIVAESESFDTVYSSTDEEATGNLNFNGDDNLELRFGGTQNTGVLVDVYGEPGTQGSGLAWEFTDSRAVRLESVTSGATTWDSAEWEIVPATVADATPRVHPETLVTAPSGVSATAQSASEISIDFAPAASEDVVIVFNTTGNFTTPSGIPLVGQPLAGGTVLYVGQSAPFAHTGLDAETEYFYSVFTYVDPDYSNAVTVDATTLIAGLLNAEDFEDPAGGADDWFAATVTGDDRFEIIQITDTNKGSRIDGSFNISGNEDTPDNQYLISPALDFSARVDGIISFEFVGGYDDEDPDSFELVYSTDYSGSGDPSTANWTEIAFDFSANLAVGDPTALAPSGNVDLPAALNGESTVHLAFRYTADGTTAGSEQWAVDSIIVTASDAAPTNPLGDYLSDRGLTSADLDRDTNGNGFPVLVEYVGGLDGKGNDIIEFGIDPDAFALTLRSDRATEPGNIVVRLLATSDLTVAPVSVDYTHTVIDNQDGSYTHRYIEIDPPDGADQRFLSLEIETAAP